MLGFVLNDICFSCMSLSCWSNGNHAQFVPEMKIMQGRFHSGLQNRKFPLEETGKQSI